MHKFLLCLFLLLFSPSAFGQTKIGFVSDLPATPKVQELLKSILEELDKTTGVNQKIVAPPNLQFLGLASADAVQSAYAQMDCKLVISIGGLASKALSQLPNLKTPVIGIGVMDPDLQDIPFAKGTSGKKNFTYILTSRDIIAEMSSFKKIADFEELSIITNPSVSKSIDFEKGIALLDSLQTTLNIKIKRVEAESSVSATIAKLDGAQAVYLGALIDKDNAYLSALIAHFQSQKIPSFSTQKNHVELGVLACSSGDNSLDQLVRRTALLGADLIAGQEAAQKQVALDQSENIYLNIATARAIDYAPAFDLLLTVNIVGKPPMQGPEYSFNEIAETALKENLNIKVSYQDIKLSELDIKSNRSLILPQLNSGMTAAQINPERANALVNSSEQTLSLDLILSQVIYSEEALAAIRVSKYLKTAQEYQTEVDVLNVMLDTYGAYLNVLSAKTNLDIQRRNLNNTKVNLELAKVRVAIGSANNSDLYRWESEVANATQSVVEAQTAFLTVKLQLNNLLANNLEREFTLKDIGLKDELFQSFRNSPIVEMVNNPVDLNLISDFLIQESLSKNPNKLRLLENIKAAERQFTMNKRLFFVPTVAVQAQGSQILYRGGEGSEDIETGIPGVESNLQNQSWSVAANLSFPIFTGLNRNVNRQKSIVQLKQLKLNNNNLDLGLDLSIRSSTLNLLSSTTNLKYSQVSAENATKNFELIQSYYKEGLVNITQVIDAQQAALSAELQAAIAVYEFIFANLQVEYSLGFYTMFLSEEETASFQNRFFQFQANH